MKHLIENLPESARKDFMENYALDMIENLQATFNSLAITFAHSVRHELDMIQSQVENVRGSLIWMDEQLQELNKHYREHENSKYLQTLKK